MKIIQFLLATLLLFIGLIFSYEKVELNDNHVIEEPIIREEIIEENTTSKVIDNEKDITLIDNIESTKAEKTTTTNNTTKKESKTKNNNKKTQSKTDNKKMNQKKKKSKKQRMRLLKKKSQRKNLKRKILNQNVVIFMNLLQMVR